MSGCRCDNYFSGQLRPSSQAKEALRHCEAVHCPCKEGPKGGRGFLYLLLAVERGVVDDLMKSSRSWLPKSSA
jgi:hypothetical protein